MRPLWGLDVGRARACPEVYVPREDAERVAKWESGRERVVDDCVDEHEFLLQ
jgi:hypothetical protein